MAIAAFALAQAIASAALAAPPAMVIDAFEDLSHWTATASPGASVEIARDQGSDGGQALRIDFDLGNGGFVMVRRPIALRLPENYRFSFRVRGEALPNNVEFKLVGPGGDDVWWAVERDFAFPRDWQRYSVRRSHLRYAWGRNGGTPLERVAFLEIAIAAGRGGKGSVWLDDLRFEPRPALPRRTPRPAITASTATEGHPAENVLDSDPATTWHSGRVADQQWLEIDFGMLNEFGGLVIDWDGEDYAVAYRVEAAENGGTWSELYATTSGQGGRGYVYLHDAEASRLRIVFEQSHRGEGYGIRSIAVKPLQFSASPNDFFAAIAADAAPGSFPKYFSGRQTYWTVVGVPGDTKEALLNEEGTLEVDQGSFSIEPFLYVDGKLVSWNGPSITQSLERGDLPIPSVTWETDGLRLRITALAVGPAGASNLLVRYRVENLGAARRELLLFLALRPFQVLPPWQSLNVTGGVTQIRSIAAREPGVVWVNEERPVLSLTRPERFGAATFEEDLVASFLASGRVPPRSDARDLFGYAAGAFEYRLALDAGAGADVVLASPFHPPAGMTTLPDESEPPERAFEQRLVDTAAAWARQVDRVALDLPGEEGARIAQIARTTIAYMLVNRDGAAIQPGSRNYSRSWIRDGAFTSSALLEMGHTEEVRDFLRWYATFQLADGRVPCCIDRRGPDRVPEHDSNGAFVFAAAAYYRYTRDIGFLWEIWPAVASAVDFMAAQRAQRMTDKYRHGDKQAYFGLLPESISHEGYSARPVHAYWDDFFAMRGFKDAADLADAVGDAPRATAYAVLRDDFRHDLYASLDRAMTMHHIDFIPGSVELGDFDATSTAAAVSLVGELEHLPPAALQRTFDMYLQHVRERAARPPGEEGYTPYELRNVDALIQMGRRQDAIDLLRLIVADVRPPAWNEWAEVVWRDPSLPRFIGDMPHTWVGASYLRAVRSMLVYERESDDALVLGAGVPAEWLPPGSAVGAARMPTPHGPLAYRVVRDDPRRLTWSIGGDLHVPPGGLVLAPPLEAPIAAVRVNGAPIDTFTADTATVRVVPAEVVLELAAAPESTQVPSGASRGTGRAAAPQAAPSATPPRTAPPPTAMP